MGPSGKLPVEFPKGYAAFYCMKYEINQGQYGDFFSQLTLSRATATARNSTTDLPSTVTN